MRSPTPLRRTAASLLVLVLVACSNDDAGDSSTIPTPAEACPRREAVTGRPLRIATTVAPLTSIAANIAAGTPTVITGVVPEGTNSHTYEPPPSVAATLEQADIVFLNGLGLEDPTRKLAEANAADGAVRCELGSAVLPRDQWVFDFSFPEDGGKPNPHLWTNPPMGRQYAEVIRDALTAADPANAATYAANFTAFAAKVDALDAAMSAASGTLTPEQRQLLTYHDAYAYFAKHYGWTVIGAIQPSSFDEPSAKEVAALIEQVRSTGVKAIFGSEVFPSSVLEQIGKETGARYIDVLRDDDLPGAPGEPEHSWQGLMRFNFVTMVEALGGDAGSLRSLDMTPRVVDRAFYPQ